MRKSIKLSDFAKLSQEEKDKAIQELLKAVMEPPTPEELAELDAKILTYETKYGIPTDKIHESIDNGTLKETNEVCSWIMLANLRERIKGV